MNGVTDTVGNTYSNHILTIGHPGVVDNGTAYAIYYLGGNYNTLSGTIAINDTSRNEEKYTTELSILCDENIVYATGQTSRAFAPTEFSVSVEGCQWLKIYQVNYREGEATWHENYNFILSDWKLQ